VGTGWRGVEEGVFGFFGLWEEEELDWFRERGGGEVLFERRGSLGGCCLGEEAGGDFAIVDSFALRIRSVHLFCCERGGGL
jgi:hypothetical protein